MSSPDPAPYTHNDHSDEIDLRDLALMLIEGWRWIIGAIVAAVVASFSYIVITTPVYSTTLTYSPAVDGLRAINTMPGVNYSADEVAKEFTARLSSYENFSVFLENSEETRKELLSALNNTAENDDIGKVQRKFFAEDLGFLLPEEEEVTTSAELIYSENLAGPEFLNWYYRWTDQAYRALLVQRAQRAVDIAIEKNQAKMLAHEEAHEEAISAQITRMEEGDSIQLAKLKDQLDAEIKSTVAARQERVRILRQAESIATLLDITRPKTPRDLSREPGSSEVIYAEINSQNALPLYFMGTEALQAEREVIEKNLEEETKSGAIRDIEKKIALLQNNRDIEALQDRVEESPFIEEYNRLKQENILLRSNIISPEEIEVTDVINWAYTPDRPDSPRKALIMALSLILGGMLGVMLVFLVRFSTSLRDYRQQKSI
ncbi:MAG: GNVR domain-containing protein [Halomonadaceae bacterium]